MFIGLRRDAADSEAPSRRGRHVLWFALGAVVGLTVVLALAFMLALGGVDLGCLGGGSAAGPAPSRSAVKDIPAKRRRLYQRAGRTVDIDWTFLAAIGAQECGHSTCAGDNGSGCAGPMQIAFRRQSPCSHGRGPTLWAVYGTDGNGDGHKDVNDPADAVLTAAKILRRAKGAPPTGGSYAEYRQAACNYYGSCSTYADAVMARAVVYGFHGAGSPPPANPTLAKPATDKRDESGCGDAQSIADVEPIGSIERLREPRELVLLPSTIVAPGYAPQRCDARIVPNVVYLARRFQLHVTACAAIHSLSGEHPLGAAVDLVPATGNWGATTDLAARALGWRPSCAATGIAPTCAHPPFRFIGYSGYPGHGDPAHCPAPSCAPHLHLSWLTSASESQPENAARTRLFSPRWIDVFTTGENPHHVT